MLLLFSIWLGLASIISCEDLDHYNKHDKNHHDNHFDLLIFTQHWPYTTCLDWEEKRHGGCTKIDRPSWTVHGIWPTQFHKEAPSFCNNSWPFDASNLESIRSDMETYWPDVEMRDVPNSLYEHEWIKHGTCAVTGKLPGVSSQKDYFAAGIRLAKENPLTDWLAAWDVIPSDTQRYSMESIWNAVLLGAGTRPHVDCDKIDGDVYIKEIKLCYDKNLTRVDCDGIKARFGDSEADGLEESEADANMMGTCLRYHLPKYHGIIYPTNSVPPVFVKTINTNRSSTTIESSTTMTSASTITSVTKNTSTTSGSTPVPSSTSSPSPSPKGTSSGLIGGVVCAVLAVSSVGLAIGYIIYRRGLRNRRGYESL